MDRESLEDIEIDLLLLALQRRYGYDFHNYSRDSLRRRIFNCLSTCDFTHVSEIIPKLLYEGRFVSRLIAALTVNVTTMFRDPQVFSALREKVFPVLATYPFVNIWHAGCATGEEVYSMAILLKENGLYERTRIYATDLNEQALEKAREGVYPDEALATFAENYRLAGGKARFADYYHGKYKLIRMDPALRRNVVFANHNLATDGVFAETHLILCRNVFIYFDRTLQDRVLRIFHDSLARGGFLCLGDKETRELSKWKKHFTSVSGQHKICKKTEQ